MIQRNTERMLYDDRDRDSTGLSTRIVGNHPKLEEARNLPS